MSGKTWFFLGFCGHILVSSIRLGRSVAPDKPWLILLRVRVPVLVLVLLPFTSVFRGFDPMRSSDPSGWGRARQRSDLFGRVSSESGLTEFSDPSGLGSGESEFPTLSVGGRARRSSDPSGRWSGGAVF